MISPIHYIYTLQQLSVLGLCLRINDRFICLDLSDCFVSVLILYCHSGVFVDSHDSNVDILLNDYVISHEYMQIDVGYQLANDLCFRCVVITKQLIIQCSDECQIINGNNQEAD